MSASIIGPYRIISQLGEGGMGVVYEAQHSSLGRRAALKVLHPQHCGDHAAVQRFFHEAKAAATIEHQGIITIYEFGFDEANGRAFIAMELLRGESLRGRLDRLATLPEQDALRIGRQIANALAAAHEAGIVHRDLKPDNVFLTPDPEVVGGERVKLLDFGIAKLSEDLREAGHTTKSGVFMGTPAYASPEQCDGAKTLGPPSDLYALGCMLYHCMCGRPPFVAEGVGRLISAHLYTAPVAPQNVAKAISPGFADLLMQLLAKAPEQRPASAARVAEHLRNLGAPSLETALPGHGSAPPAVRPGAPVPTTLSGASNASSQPPRSRSKRGWLITAGLAVLVAAAASVITILSSSDPDVAASGLDTDAAASKSPTSPTSDAAPAPVDATPDGAADAAVDAGARPAVATSPSPRKNCRFDNLIDVRTRAQIRRELARVESCKKVLGVRRAKALQRTLLNRASAGAKPPPVPR